MMWHNKNVNSPFKIQTFSSPLGDVPVNDYSCDLTKEQFYFMIITQNVVWRQVGEN